MEWVEEGLVRSEKEDGKVVQVNIDDVRIEVETMVSRSLSQPFWAVLKKNKKSPCARHDVDA